MGSCSYESMSSISERIFREEQYPELEFSNETSIEHENRSGFFKKEDLWSKNSIRKKKNQVFLEGYVETSDEDDLVRAKSLTDEDLDELKGCFDLGFGFSYDEIPELCNTLPALELCYSMSQKFLDEQQKSPEVSPPLAAEPETVSPPPAPIANWKISSPGDHPEDVKARLKYWAQAVACTSWRHDGGCRLREVVVVVGGGGEEEDCKVLMKWRRRTLIL
ncbi:unnamed protein product [Lactuca saligna]|uniref:Uncharacterized protein n=1 Tax=Lactuca saligna TaxID=75948 RepID=A0AA35ZDU3_LACSI|nr:unnamed protein product [Lactuca saligna]